MNRSCKIMMGLMGMITAMSVSLPALAQNISFSVGGGVMIHQGGSDSQPSGVTQTFNNGDGTVTVQSTYVYANQPVGSAVTTSYTYRPSPWHPSNSGGSGGRAYGDGDSSDDRNDRDNGPSREQREREREREIARLRKDPSSMYYSIPNARSALPRTMHGSVGTAPVCTSRACDNVVNPPIHWDVGSSSIADSYATQAANDVNAVLQDIDIAVGTSFVYIYTPDGKIAKSYQVIGGGMVVEVELISNERGFKYGQTIPKPKNAEPFRY